MKVNVGTECWRRRWLMVFLTRGLFVPSIRPQCRPVGGRAEGVGSYSRDDRHKRETGIPVRVAMCEAVVLKEMIEFGAPGGRVERDEGSRQKRAGTGARSMPALQNSRGGGVCPVGQCTNLGPTSFWRGQG